MKQCLGLIQKLIGLGVGLDGKNVGWDDIYILKEYENAMVESKLQTNLSS